MKTLAKAIGYIIAIVVLILIIAAILLKTLVNPNDYRDKITQLVKQKTGRTLLIQGDIKLQYFPWIGIDVKQVTLDNPQGFTPSPFVKIGDAALKIKVLPLFWGNVEIKKIALHDTTINLITNANGLSNWQPQQAAAQNKNKVTHTTSTATPAPQQHKNTKRTTDISISNIEIDNANVHIINRQSAQRFDLTQFNLDSSSFNLDGEPFSIKTSYSLAQTAPQLKLTMQASSQIAFDQYDGDITLSDTNIAGTITNLYSKLAKPVSFDTRIDKFVVNQKEFELEGYVSKIANFTVKANIKADRLKGLKKLQGNIEIPKFSPKQLAKQLNLPVKNSQQFQINNASANIKITTSGNKIQLNPMTLKLDDATVNAKATYTTEPTANLTFAISANKLNLDELLPANNDSRPKSTANVRTTVSSSNKTAASPSTATSNSALVDTNWQGKINVNNLIINKITFNNLRINTTNNAGHITFAPIKANLYNGSVDAQATVLANKSVPDYSFSATVAHVNIGQALTSMAHKQVMDGNANFNTQITTSGNTHNAIMRNLNGSGQLLVNNGKLFGFNLDSLVAQASAFLGKGKVGKPKLSIGKETDFSRLSGSYKINHGLLTNNDLALVTNSAMATGRGQINMVNQTINYRMQVGPKAATSAQQPWNFPLVIQGSLDNPKITPNIASIVGQVIKKVIEDQSKKTGKQIHQFFKGLFN